MLGDALDDVHHGADLASIGCQFIGNRAGRVNCAREVLDGDSCIAGEPLALHGQIGRIAGRFSCTLYVAGDLQSRGCHLVDSGCYLVGFGALLGQTFAAATGNLAGFLRLFLEACRAVTNPGKTGLQASLLAVNRHLQLAHCAAKRGIHLRQQGIADAVAGHFDDALQAVFQCRFHRIACRQAGKGCDGHARPAEQGAGGTAGCHGQDRWQDLKGHTRKVALNCIAAPSQALVKRGGSFDLTGSGFDPH